MSSDAMPSAIMPLAPIAAPDILDNVSAPVVAQPIITERKVIASTLSSPAPAPVDFDRVTARPLAQNAAQQAIKPAPVQEIAVASNNRSFDALLENDVPASGRVANKQILTADASTAVKVTDSILAESSSF